MAERRMIYRKASTSIDLAELGEAHGGWAVAFALSLIPHYDRWGCVPADKVHDIPPDRYQDVVFAYHCVGGLQEAEADQVIRQLASRPL